VTPVEVIRGDGPIVLGMPHIGTYVPDAVKARLNANGRALADTDWHIDRLYEDLLPGATVVKATFHRYVVDANRDPAGVSLYPGQNTTTLCPLTDFDGTPIWEPGQEPTEADILERRDTYHAPYHAALAAEVARVKARHGVAVLYDCHSIRSVIPFLFEGTLPAINIGTDGGVTCAKEIEQATEKVALSSPFSTVLNGRFRGGWTTRAYGQPKTGVHAIQMELAQSAYLNQECSPWTYDTEKAERLRPWLKDILTAIADAATKLTKDADK